MNPWYEEAEDWEDVTQNSPWSLRITGILVALLVLAIVSLIVIEYG